MQKEIIFEKGTIKIIYSGKLDDFNYYKNERPLNPIIIQFIPCFKMTENQCLNYTDEIMFDIVNEVKLLIKQNSELYDNFIIDYNSKFTGFNLDKNEVLSSQMTLKTVIKDLF
jgi:hypothetical protein